VSINKEIIGKAMRLGSIVVKAPLIPDERPYTDIHTYCLHFAKGGKCNACVPLVVLPMPSAPKGTTRLNVEHTCIVPHQTILKNIIILAVIAAVFVKQSSPAKMESLCFYASNSHK
jgi:hypothetical protein